MIQFLTTLFFLLMSAVFVALFQNKIDKASK